MLDSDRFLKKYETSFQSKLIGYLNENKCPPESASITPSILRSTVDEVRMANRLSEALSVDSFELVRSVLITELEKVVSIKRENSTLQSINEFYNDVVSVDDKAINELNKLITNYQKISLSSVEHEALCEHAKREIGLNSNNFHAYKLRTFDGKPMVEIVFYLGNNATNMYRNAWLGVKGSPLKYLAFSRVSHLSLHAIQVSMFANSPGFNHLSVGSRGLSYEP